MTRTPLIRLETLSKQTTICVLLLTWVAVSFSIALAFMDTATKTIYSVSGAHCNETQPIMGCTKVVPGSNTTEWYGGVYQVNALSGPLVLDIYPLESRGKFAQIVRYNLTIQGKLCSTCGWETVVHRSNWDTAVLCGDAPGNCAPVHLFDLGGIASGYVNYYVKVTWIDFDLNDVASHVVYTFQYQTFQIILAEVVSRLTFVTISLVFVPYWLFKVTKYHKGWKCWLVHQQWVATTLFPGLLFWQNPVVIYTGLQSKTDPWVSFMSDIGEEFGLASLMFFSLLMMSGLKFSSPPWITFYLPKILILLTFLGSSVALDFLAYPTLFGELVSQRGRTMTALNSLVFTSVLVWLLHFIISMYRTQKVLKKLPYLETRYQQLSFRFYLTQAFLLLLYLLVTYGILAADVAGEIVAGQSSASVSSLFFVRGRTQPLGKVTLFSIYVWLAAYLYLPPGKLSKSDNGLPYAHYCRLEEEMHLLRRRHSSGLLADQMAKLKHRLEEAFDTVKDTVNTVKHTVKHRFSIATDASRTEFLIPKDHSDRSPTPQHDVPVVFCLETACWLFELAWQAYLDPEDDRTTSGWGILNVEQFGFELIAFIRNDATETYGFVAKQKAGNKIVASFRGSSSMKNVKTDIRIGQTTHDFGGNSFLQDVPGLNLMLSRVHKGFLEAYNSIRSEFLEILDLAVQEYGRGDTAFEDVASPSIWLATRREEGGFMTPRDSFSFTKVHQRNPDVQIYITGHSLGGALATLAAYDVATRMQEEPIMYNFGCPRVGNHTFARHYNQNVPHSFRVVFDGDFITGIPKLMFMYKHIGHEIVIDSFGNLIVDPSFVEAKFQLGSKSSVKSHTMALYRGGLFACLGQGYSGDDVLPETAEVEDDYVLVTVLEAGEGPGQWKHNLPPESLLQARSNISEGTETMADTFQLSRNPSELSTNSDCYFTPLGASPGDRMNPGPILSSVLALQQLNRENSSPVSSAGDTSQTRAQADFEIEEIPSDEAVT